MQIAKQEVRNYWQTQACGSQNATASKFSRDYFEEIERHRYSHEPEIFSFAQFTRHYGEKILEIGVGAGTDFLQWVRASTQSHGIDLTEEAVTHTNERLALYGLTPKDLRVADCENLPYDDETFDLVYSWGVLHHTPDTSRALAEVMRVTRMGGKCKIMLYNRRSLTAFYVWCKWALFKARPWKSKAWCLEHYVESPGTKAFTRREVERMLAPLHPAELRISTILTNQDRLYRFWWPFRWAAEVIAAAMGRNRWGWYMTVEFSKPGRIELTV